MSEPEQEKIVVVRRRRRTSRHRRNRLIRRILLATVAALCTAAASSVALRYISPSLFRAQRSAPPTFQQAEQSRNHLLAVEREIERQDRNRPVYPYSVVPGGVETVQELKWAAEHDPVVGAHYAGFDYDHARIVRLTLAKTVYVSYRIGNHIYWTRRRVHLKKGEKLITDGRMTARSRCANRVEEVPQQASSPSEPPVEKFEQPARVSEGTAVENPPVPFQSALLNRQMGPGFDPMPPLSLYSPFSGGSWIPLAPPPLPSVCAPGKKGNGLTDGDADDVGKKKKKGICGSGGGTETVPEPGTWLMMITGLGGVYWQVRRKFSRA